MIIVNKQNIKEIAVVSELSHIAIDKGFIEVNKVEYQPIPASWESFFDYVLEPGYMTCDIRDNEYIIKLSYKLLVPIYSLKAEVKRRIFENFNAQSSTIKSKWPESEESTWAYKIDEINKWDSLSTEDKKTAILDKNDPRFGCLFWESHPTSNLTEDSIFIIDNMVKSIKENSYMYKKYMSILIGKKNKLIENLAYLFSIEEFINFDTRVEVTIEDFNRSGDI
jgi:hypothetical protein